MSQFFEPLRKIIRNLEKLTPEVLVFNALDRNPELQERILDLVRIEQLFKKGVDGEGTDLNTLTQSGFGYASITKERKRRKNQPTDRVTLFDTGAFYKSFRLILTRFDFHIDAQAQKPNGNLFEEFGDDIIELSEESIDRVIEMIIPLMQKEFKNAI